ncbi:VCBS repeat-containing protein [Bradyrhizobium sp. Rc2d]|uniref:VCBS domain-containing protein n=1 Tax=Bradyrhizobium sp. Rc2d TaxID=1855321 RepID=UPI0008877A35|nr:VCBS domain-containing protein [Bradyrhizobium sp. Rc2d]SDJ76252.1 VCBS repeat-containing protein [Bradyrhizobium sp. Rc2d]
MSVASDIQVGNGAATSLPVQIIGHIHTMIGCGTLTRASGVATQAVAGAPVYRADVIETDADGQITLRFIDGTLFNISGGTRVALNDFVFEVEGMSHTALFDVTRGSFSFVLGRLAEAGSLRLNTPIAGIRTRGHAGGFGMLTLAALTFSAAQNAEAADPDVIVLDDDSITYKDLAHGAFELVTKEPIPRHIIVEDPGETIILKKVGSSISVNQVTNTAARMDELRAEQQDVLANLAQGQGPHGSSTPPFVKSQLLQPINFVPPDAPELQTLPTVLPFAIIEPLGRLPPTLNTGAGPAELDTVVFDTFTATTGTFSASSTNGSGQLIFGVIGASAGNTLLNGVTYDLSKTSPYGTLYVNSTSGAYTFVPDDAAINALKAPTTDGFVITVSDGDTTVNQTFTITVNGVNDAAIISGTTTGSTIEAGGIANGTPGTPIATGTLTDTDVDDPPNTFTTVSSPTTSAGGYGTFTMTAAGVWTYTLDNGNAAVQALNAGDTLIDSFTVTTIGGTAQVVTITIHGASDAAVISGATTGAVIEAGGIANANPGTPTATGTLTDTDVDTTANAFTAVGSPTASAAGYGTFTMTAAGVWTYTLDNANAAVQALNAGQTLTDTFTVTTLDGTAQVVTVTIHGSNDAAVISGTTAGSVTEAGGVANATPGAPSATGTLVAADVDNASNTFTTVSSPKASTSGYGTFTITAAGVWAYTLDNANGAVQALNVGGTLTDSFTVTTLDGTPQVVTVIINGTNDAAIISGTTTGSVIEAGTSSPGAPVATGTLTDTDVDNAPNTFTAVSSPVASDDGYGTFTMTAAGVWTYTLDNNNSVVQALDVGDTLTDTFTVTSIDGTTQAVTIAIHGASDADPNDFDNLATGSVVISDPPNVYGTPGSETIAGGGDTGQIIYAGASSDTVNGTGKADVLYGGSGNDTIKGNDGDDVIYGGSGNDTINGNNGSDTIIGGFGADQLTGSNGNDRFTYLFVADSNASQFDTITDFASGADKIDLTALGALGFVILALSSTNTAVPAHTIAWLYDSAANETIVYVNATDQTLHIGDSGLLEVHLQGIATIDASDFILAPAAAPVMAAASELLDLTATAQSDATAVTTTASEVSSDSGSGDGTISADGSSTIQSSEATSSLNWSWDQTEGTEYSSLSSSADEQTYAIETAVAPSASGPSTISQHMAAPTEVSFVFSHLAAPDTTAGKDGAISGSGQMPDIAIAALNFAHNAAELHAGHGLALGSSDAGNHGVSPPGNAAQAAGHPSDDTAKTTLNPGLLKSSTAGANHSPSSEAAEQHDPPHGASGLKPANPQQLGDSFQFKDDASQGSQHSAGLDHLSDLAGHHDHAGTFHGSEPASVPETSPPDVDPAYGAGTVQGHVLHDLIV